MIILSNSLTETVDEGCLKVMSSLAKRLKTGSNAAVISYDRQTNLADLHLSVNKFLLSPALIRAVRQANQRVLYLPFPARPIATAIRIFCLCRYAPRGVDAALVMNGRWSGAARLLMKWSGADFLVFSAASARLYGSLFGQDRVRYLKTGVDTRKFCPVSPAEARALKEKYGLCPDRPVVLHVGHLNRGRNIGTLLDLDPGYQVLLVVSTLTKSEQDPALRRELLARSNIRLMEDYLPAIQEIYQLADVYFFPVAEEGRCIDVPLSCLEAAACGRPVVTTAFGEMEELLGRPGFYPITGFEPEALNSAVALALAEGRNPREAVLDYDWSRCMSQLKDIMQNGK